MHVPCGGLPLVESMDSGQSGRLSVHGRWGQGAAARRGLLAEAGCKMGVGATVIVTSLHVGSLESNLGCGCR